MHISTNSRLLEWLDNYVYGQYSYVYACIYMYLDSIQQCDSDSAAQHHEVYCSGQYVHKANRDTVLAKKVYVYACICMYCTVYFSITSLQHILVLHKTHSSKVP